MDHVLKLSKPKIIFSSDYPLKKLVNVAKQNSYIKNIYVFSSNSNNHFEEKFIKSFSQLINDQSPKSSFVLEKTNHDENVALIACSSGTTGLPKGVQLTQKNLMYTIDRQFDLKSLLEESTVLSVIPWFHNYGCLTMILMPLVGGKLVFLPRFEEHLFLNCIQVCIMYKICKFM